MNYLMVRRLILKDWYLNRWLILGLDPRSASLLWRSSSPAKQVAFLLSIILLCMVIIGVGAQLAIVTTVNERKEQTLAFIMSLPVSWREYTAAKILANLIIFLIPWLIITAGALGVLCLPGATHGLIPFTAIMSVEMLVTTCLIIVAGIITESRHGPTVAILCLQPRPQRPSATSSRISRHLPGHVGRARAVVPDRLSRCSSPSCYGRGSAPRSHLLRSVAKDRLPVSVPIAIPRPVFGRDAERLRL